jgi:predicted GNAT family acetyltransferase
MLLRDEAVNNWTIGFLSDYDTGSRLAKNEQLTLLGVEDDRGEIIATAVSTGESLVLTQMPAEAISTLLEFLERERIDQPKTSGPAETASSLANQWAQRRKVEVHVNLSMRIMRLTEVRFPGDIPGSFRAATMDDLDLLIPWGEGFDRELGFEDSRDMRDVVSRRIELNRLYVWCNPGPVSMAGIAGPTPNGMRVNFVYTPAEFRCKGYARACVARLSQKLLDSGKKFAFLYVDAENPTTNRLYSAIGYESIADWEDWRFGVRKDQSHAAL